MKKIAFVNQRYGAEIIGGSELYTRQIVQKLKSEYEIEILTSKAKTYDDWSNYFKKDIEEVDGITVHRFGTKRTRNKWLQKLIGKLFSWFHIDFGWLDKIWIKAQGPYMPELIEYIKEHRDDYDKFVFVTYLYYPTVFGLPEVREKAVFVPTAHDEYCIHLKIFHKLFQMPKTFIFLTEEEKKFVENTFPIEDIPNEVAGIGIDVPEGMNESNFRDRYGIQIPYIVYAGRIEPDKGCGEMFSFFQKYSKIHSDLSLVVLGKQYMDIPVSEKIIFLGFLPEKDKFEGIKGAAALWLPSRFESLSMAVLEAMAVGTPVIVNGQSEILKGHCQRSEAGMWYNDYESFEQSLDIILKSDKKKLGNNARTYIQTYYSWEAIIKKWENVLNRV